MNEFMFRPSARGSIATETLEHRKNAKIKSYFNLQTLKFPLPKGGGGMWFGVLVTTYIQSWHQDRDANFLQPGNYLQSFVKLYGLFHLPVKFQEKSA